MWSPRRLREIDWGGLTTKAPRHQGKADKVPVGTLIIEKIFVCGGWPENPLQPITFPGRSFPKIQISIFAFPWCLGVSLQVSPRPSHLPLTDTGLRGYFSPAFVAYPVCDSAPRHRGA